MIILSNESVMNFENAIRGMRNPLNSWNKSDSGYCADDGLYILGKNDLDLAVKLCNSGSDHRKFLRQIMVSVDITAPMYWWKEFDTYKVGTVANSCSTMHTIHKKEFELSDFSVERMTLGTMETFKCVIDTLEWNRNKFNETKDKAYWDNMIQLLPMSYNQMRTVTLNYEVLRNMYHSRRTHKLEEWRYFCKWIEQLPYAYALIIRGDNNETH